MKDEPQVVLGCGPQGRFQLDSPCDSSPSSHLGDNDDSESGLNSPNFTAVCILPAGDKHNYINCKVMKIERFI